MLLQVIILPIAWHQRKEESARILAAAETAEQLLAAAGITSRIDDTDNYTPGQKMKYWWVLCVCGGGAQEGAQEGACGWIGEGKEVFMSVTGKGRR
jgi:hypothetical protein